MLNVTFSKIDHTKDNLDELLTKIDPAKRNVKGYEKNARFPERKVSRKINQVFCKEDTVTGYK